MNFLVLFHYYGNAENKVNLEIKDFIHLILSQEDLVYFTELLLNCKNTKSKITAYLCKIFCFVRLLRNPVIRMVLQTLFDITDNKRFTIKEAAKLHFKHYSCLVIILLNAGLHKSLFST